MHIRQPTLNTVVVERQTLVVETQEMQDGRVEIVDVHAACDGVHAELVRRAVHHAATNSSASHEI